MRAARFSSVMSSGEFRGPKPEYWGNSDYRRIVCNNDASFLLVKSIEGHIGQIKDGILKRSLIMRMAGRLLTAYFIAMVVVFLGTFYFLAVTQKTNWVILLCILAILYYGLMAGFGFFEKKYKHLQESILLRNSSKFKHLDMELAAATTQRQNAERNILSAWDKYCVEYRDYPPDWTERKVLVKTRDDYRCTNCEWPTGFRVHRRDLHVHHVVNLSKGGSNSVDNLVTLCHICHRQQEGSGHKRIKYIKKQRR